jgi:hypothetical protein
MNSVVIVLVVALTNATKNGKRPGLVFLENAG